MMLYPSIMELMKKAESRYSLVIAASKRAREICEETEDGKDLDGAKGITRAVSEIESGDVLIIEGRDTEPDKRAILENTIMDKMSDAFGNGDEYSDDEENEDEDEE